MADTPSNPILPPVMEPEDETLGAVRVELQEARDYAGALRAEAQSALIELSDRTRQLKEIREVLNLGDGSTHPQVLSGIGQLKDRLRAQKRRARLAALVKGAPGAG